jgi:uncharacterized protein
MDIFFGYFVFILIGVLLGMVGGGGSILTLPVLVYVFKMDTYMATSYSLGVIGCTSLIGSYQYFKQDLIKIRVAITLSFASLATVILSRKFILKSLPPEIVLDGLVLEQKTYTMLLFALVMLYASKAMIRPRREKTVLQINHSILTFQLLGYGVGIGLVTGLLGAGGGFLLIPVLVSLVRLPMREAIGTSLSIIALNSLVGFASSQENMQVDWYFMLLVMALCVVGMLLGSQIAKVSKSSKLRKFFGWFVLTVGTFILLNELIRIVVSTTRFTGW